MHSLCKLQVVNWISTKGEQFLDKHTEIGDSVGHVKTLQEEFENFENKAKVSNVLQSSEKCVIGSASKGTSVKAYFLETLQDIL